jgi:TonB-linked SusC/RagA family outer membrane protein
MKILQDLKVRHSSESNADVKISFCRALWLSLLLGIMFPFVTNAQTMEVSGVVTESNGTPIPGVNITVAGEAGNGTISDMSGAYSLEVAADGVLNFSFIGFESVQVPVNGQRTIYVTLEEASLGLDEVVVVGYGVQKKSDVTGAMVSVDSEELNSRPVSNAFEALQGKAAGVDITTNERPGEIGDIRIRGVRSLTASNSPLYVVDGVPLMSSSAIETLNPRDIESIDILKDASATAIYGSRGANGVVLVTTSRGEKGQFTLNYSGTLTVEELKDRSSMMDAGEYITWRRWAYYNMDPEAYPRGDNPDIDIDRVIFKENADPNAWANIMRGWQGGTWDGSQVQTTDWTDFVTQTSYTQEHTLSASGGTDKMTAYGSFGYLDNQGTQKGQTYERYTTKLSLDITPVNWFKMGGSINASWSNQDYGMSRLGASSSSGPAMIYEAAQRVFAYAVPYDDEGERVIHPGGDGNVYTVIDEWNQSTQQRQMFRAIGSFYGELDFGNIFETVKGLKYRMNFGPDYRNWREGVYIDQNSVNRLGGTSYARLKNQRDFSWTLDNMLTYNNSFGLHTLGATLLQTSSSWNIESSSMNAQNISNPDYLWNAFGTVDVTSSDSNAGFGSGLTERQLESYMGRLNYSFNDRYLLTLSGRWDGASQLAEGHKWAFFPSAAIGWRITQESFMQNVDWVNQLKLRVGVGSTGNSAVDPYSTKGGIQSFFVPFGGADNLQGFSAYEPNYTGDAKKMANKELSWETTTQFNFGIDFVFLNGRIGGTLDLYKSKTEDLLMDMTIPTLSGYPSTFANVGETKNHGVDITLNTVNVRTRDFEWLTNLSAAWQKDEVVSLAYGKNDMIDNGWFIGESINVIYDIAEDGLWKEGDVSEMDQFNANGHDFEVGKVKPVDQNGDHVIDAEDRVIIGNENPRWTIGFNNTFIYKGFELSCMIYGRLGYDYDTGGEGQLGRYNQRSIDYWTPDNRDADYQKPIYNEAGGDAYSSLIGYYSGSFLKIRNISLGYNFNQSTLSQLGIKNLKLYVQATNPGFLYSSIDWIDMDTRKSTYNQGFVFGLNVGF